MSQGYVIARGGPVPVVYLYGGIGTPDAMGNEIVVDDLVSELLSLKDPLIEFRMSSIGGNVDEGFRLFNAILNHPARTRIVIDGYAHSAATYVLQAGDERIAMEISELMVHAPRGGAPLLTANEHRKAADMIDSYMAQMMVAYGRHGIPESAVRDWMDGSDHYFTPRQALAAGLIDRVEEMQKVENASDVYRVIAMSAIDAAMHAPDDNPNPAALRRYTVETATMADNETTGASAVTPTSAAKVVAAHSASVKRAMAEGAKAEAERRSSIEDVFARAYDGDPANPVTAIRDQCLKDINCDVSRAREMYLDYLETRTADPILAPQTYAVQPQPKAPPQASRYLGGAMLTAGMDQRDKRAGGLVLALSVRCGLERDPAKVREAESGELIGMTIAQLMGEELRASGLPANGTSQQIISTYLRHLPVLASGPSHGTDHLPAVLGNIAEKAMMDGWSVARETWAQWTRPGTLRNFQPATAVAASFLDKLTRMLPHQEFEYGDLADQKQTRQLYQHGLRYGFPYEALINDDVGALAEAMSGWGEAASATIGDYVHAALFASNTGFGQTMDEDSKALFHADHHNYIASGSGAAPSETTLNAARAAMMSQTDPNGRVVAAIPRYLIHGPSLWGTVRKVLNSQDLQSVTVDGATGATVLSGSINSARDMNLTPIEDYRILASAPAATAWALASDRRTVEVSGLNGQPRPMAELIPMGNIWGINYQLTCPFAVTVLDFRGLYMNYGV